MAKPQTLIRFNDLVTTGYFPSVGAWIQVAPSLNLTTILNAFNTLGNQSMEIFLFDQNGNDVGEMTQHTLGTNELLRLDIEDLVPEDQLPFEGCLWIWSRGDTAEGNIGLQAIDLDFIDRTRPKGHVLGNVHLIFDFLNTLGHPPYLDLVSPRVLVGKTPEGADQYRNFLGIAHIPLDVSELMAPDYTISVTNEQGEKLGEETVSLPFLGSWFGSLESLFPTLPEFLMRPGESRGYGVVNVREQSNRQIGGAGMVKVVDQVSGELMVNHMNDRNFARPAMKDG